MSLKFLKDPSKAEIKKSIKDLRGIIHNVKERVQVALVAVIDHDSEHGDCTLAVDLVNSLPSAEDRRFVLAMFRHFGGIGVKTEKGRAINAQHLNPNTKDLSPNATKQKGGSIADPAGARAVMWYEVDQTDWYRGPPRSEFVPGTIGDVGQNVFDFGERLAKKLDGTKEVDGKTYPLFNLTPEQRKTAEQVIVGLKRLGSLMTATENLEEIKREEASVVQLIADSEGILKAITKNEREADTEVPTAEAVAG